MRRVISVVAFVLLALPCAAQNRQQDGDGKRPQASPLTSPGAVVVEVAADKEAAGGAPPAPCPGKADLRIAVVIKARANLRDRANIAGATLASVRGGAALVIEAEDGPGSPWYKVTDVATGKQGWVHGDLIRITYAR